MDGWHHRLKARAKSKQLGNPSTSLRPSCAKKWMLAEQPIQQEAELQPIVKMKQFVHLQNFSN